MSIQANANVCQNNNVNFKGKTCKSVTKYIQKQSQKEVDELVKNANYKHEVVDTNKVAEIKAKWDGVLNTIKELMGQTHKDSRMDVYKDCNFFTDSSWDAVEFSNKKLGKSFTQNAKWSDKTFIETLKDIANPKSDERLARESLNDLRGYTQIVRTPVGKAIMKHKAKNIDNFTAEAGIDSQNALQTINDEIAKATEIRNLEKLNKKLAQ